MSDFDTGDVVRNRLTKEQVQVACVHGDVFHPTGFPDRELQVGGWDVERKATSDERLVLLNALSGSTSNAHRPHCAREALAREPVPEMDPYYGCYDGD